MTTDGLSTISVELRERLIPIFGADIAIEQLALLAGGASKEAWALDLRTPQGTRQLLVRRAGGGVIHQETLTLEDEHRLLEVADAVGLDLVHIGLRRYEGLRDVEPAVARGVQEWRHRARDRVSQAAIRQTAAHDSHAVTEAGHGVRQDP